MCCAKSAWRDSSSPLPSETVPHAALSLRAKRRNLGAQQRRPTEPGGGWRRRNRRPGVARGLVKVRHHLVAQEAQRVQHPLVRNEAAAIEFSEHTGEADL